MLAVIQNREHDRVPFVVYEGISASSDDLWSLLGQENVGLLRWVTAHRLDAPNCSFETEDIHQGELSGKRTTLHTPSGSLFSEAFIAPALGSMATMKHFIQEPKDYRIIMAYFRDMIVREDLRALEQADFPGASSSAGGIFNLTYAR